MTTAPSWSAIGMSSGKIARHRSRSAAASRRRLAVRPKGAQAGVGLEYLLPALVGVFLGSTTIRPGRVNVWGTVVAVPVLAIGISGIQQLAANSMSSRCLMAAP
jgi:ribose/xylose/arabinose/galactoside ABC-type transport system permease subunit